MNKYYIYAHSTGTHGIFYIGKGSNKRLFTTGNRSEFWKRIVKKYGYTASIIEECQSEKDAFEREIYWIGHYKADGQCIANFSLGGDGVKVDQRWWGGAISKSLTGVERAKGIESKNYKDFLSKELLADMYTNYQMTTAEIGDLCGVTYTTVWSRLKTFGIPTRGNETKRKTVVCTTTGKEFESISKAAEETGVYRENLRKVLSGKYKSTGGMHFKYKE